MRNRTEDSIMAVSLQKWALAQSGLSFMNRLWKWQLLPLFRSRDFGLITILNYQQELPWTHRQLYWANKLTHINHGSRNNIHEITRWPVQPSNSQYSAILNQYWKRPKRTLSWAHWTLPLRPRRTRLKTNKRSEILYISQYISNTTHFKKYNLFLIKAKCYK